MELDHVMGYVSHFLVVSDEMHVKAMGATVVVGNAGKDEEQKLLSGHDNRVCALAASDTALLAASGQVGSSKVPGYSATVIVWDLRDCTARFTLRGLTNRVDSLNFSPDGKILAASGDGLLYFWDLDSGHVLLNMRREVTVLQWMALVDNKYNMALFGGSRGCGVEYAELAYSHGDSWRLASVPFTMPRPMRGFTCSAMVAADAVVAGTSEGDVLLFKTHQQSSPGGVFKASIPACSGGVVALVVVDKSIYAGGGDGYVRRIEDGVVQSEICVDESGIVFLAASSGDLLVGAASAKTYRVSTTKDLEPVYRGRCRRDHPFGHELPEEKKSTGIGKAVCVTAAHASPPTDVAFGSQRSDIFATCATDGQAIVWDLSDYVISSATSPQRGTLGRGARCLCWVGDVGLCVGYGDGNLRCYYGHSTATKTLSKEWEIQAHRAAVTSVVCRLSQEIAYLVSGSDDGSVRVWNLSSRQMAAQFAEHLTPVLGLVLDCELPTRFHSAGSSDLFTYELEKKRPVAAHVRGHGAPLACLDQRRDTGAKELVAADTNGTLHVWDGRQQHVSSFPQHVALRVHAIRFWGKFVALAADEVVALYDFSNADAPRAIAQGFAHSEKINSLEWSPDGRQIVSVGDDSCMCAWNVFLQEPVK